MRKIKILFIVPLPPPYHGATLQSQMKVNSKRLNQKFDIAVLPLRFARNLEEIGKFSFKKILKMFRFSFRLFFKLEIFKPDISYYAITIRGYSFYRDCLFITVLKLLRLKIIFHHHTKGVSEENQNLIKILLQKWVYRNSYSILLSPLLIYDLQHLVPEKKIFIVPNGIPDIDHKIVKKGKRCPVILFLSNMIIEKGVFVLLEAFSILKRRNRNFKGIFAGNWSYNISEKIFLEYINKLNLKDIVQFKGAVYGKEKNELFAESDIFVFPTFLKHETFGIVLLEAMRASLPVVATNEGSIPYIIQEGVTGFICKKKDPNDLAEKIEKLIEDENLRYEMGKKGRERFENHFTFEKYESSLEKIFFDVMND